MKKHVLLFLLGSFVCLAAVAQNDTRSLEFETSAVTQPSLSIMPDGKSFVFNLLGHLFRMPAKGGDAVQLTFGPYYDDQPVVSPDGKKIAFISNRDGSDGNVFILDLNTNKITGITHVFMAGSPTWSPDGTTIAFLSFLRREEYPVDKIPFFGAGDRASIHTVSVTGNNLIRLTEVKSFASLFYQADGVLTWTVTESQGQDPFPGFGMGPSNVLTVFEKKLNDGNIVRTGTLRGRTGRIALTGDKQHFYYIGGGQLRYYTLGDTSSKIIGPFKGMADALILSPDEKSLIAASDAKLWQVTISGVEKNMMNWKARVKMEVVRPAIRKWNALSPGNAVVPEVMTPRLSPDGVNIVFMAAGFLWKQAMMSGSSATKLINDNSYQLDPAFSPDGKKIAFASDRQGIREIRVMDLLTKKIKTVAAVDGYSWVLQPTWSPDGKEILYQQSGSLGAPYKFRKVNAETGSDTLTITSTGNNWNGRPHFSSDGKHIYYTARQGMFANVFQLSLQAGAKPEALTDLKRHVHDALVSPDGKWIAFRRNAEIWIAGIKPGILTDKDFRLFSKTGGRSFAFTNDASAIMYSDRERIFKKQITGNTTTALTVSLKLPAAVAKPVLISRIHVLDFTTGQFTGETSVYIENSRIVWIGSENGKKISPEVTRIDGGGRFAIPGLMDSHVHSAWENQQITEDKLIAYGVTSIRDVGSRLDIINSLKDRGITTQLPIPRYFAAGEIFEGLAPLWGDAFYEINSKEEAREYVHYSKAHNADLIKVYASLPWYLKTEVAAEAKKEGMPVVGHGISLDEITRSINFGLTSSEHGGPGNEDIVKLFANAGTWLDPTPGIFGAGTTLKLADSTTLDEKFRTFIPEEEIKAARPGRIPSDAQIASWKNILASLKHMYDSGVRLLDGTDALMTAVFHGPSVHWVLQFFSDAGIPAIDVLKIGTLRAAESVGAEKDLGSLDAGKLADILLLDANPLLDIKNTLKIWRVIKNGDVFNPETLRKKEFE